MAQEHDIQNVLQAENLLCERDNRVLFKDLNFTAHRGQVIQIKGSNGSGKTTLLRILCGLNDAFRGELTWFNKPIQDHWEVVRSSLIYMGHRVGVNKVLTPYENLRWSVGLSTSVTNEQIDHALGEMGLRGFEDSQCFTLSAGQQQRVSLSRLLLNKALLWVLDEPFTTLDQEGVKLLERLLSQHANKGGVVFVTTHHELLLPNLTVLDLG